VLPGQVFGFFILNKLITMMLAAFILA